MKLFNLVSFLAIALFTLSLSGCGDESSDPTPKPPSEQTLQKIQDGLRGSTWNVVKFEVTDGVDPLTTFTASESCLDISHKYGKSIVNFNVAFAASSTNSALTWDNKCDQGDGFIQNYTVTSVDANTFNVLITSGIPAITVVNATVLKTDILNTDGSIKSEIKLKFNQITSPLNWKYSPTVYLKKS
jgi:hypothetical protein